MVLLGVEGTEVGAWAGRLSPLLPGCTPWTQSSGAWAALTGRSSSEVAAKGFTSPQPVHMADLQQTRNPTSSPQVLESSTCSSVQLKHLSAPVSTLRWRGRQILLWGVYSQGLGNPGTGRLHDLNLGSPYSPSLKCQILVTGAHRTPWGIWAVPKGVCKSYWERQAQTRCITIYRLSFRPFRDRSIFLRAHR